MHQNNELCDDDSPTMQLCYAVDEGNIPLVKALLAQGLSVNTLGPCTESMLIRAAQFSQVEAARILLEHGANVNYQDNTCCTALKDAVVEGSLEMVTLLLDAGADMTILGGADTGNALHTASRQGHIEIARLLLQRGADPDAPDMEGCTASYLQHFFRSLGMNDPDVSTQILALLKAAGAAD